MSKSEELFSDVSTIRTKGEILISGEMKMLKRKIAAAMADKDGRWGRETGFKVIRPATRKMREEYYGLSEQVRIIKEGAISDIENLIPKAIQSMEANGFKVFYARTAEEAREYVNNLVNKGPVVKSKSNVGKEIGLNAVLEAKGLELVETDLGDVLCQISGTMPSHPLAPAVHLPVETIAELLSEQTGWDLPPVPEKLVSAARHLLRKYFLAAGTGISGANAISADTGSIILTENEGNIRAVTSLPPLHLVVAGVDKIVPNLEDGIKIVRATSAYGGGSPIGSYISVISGLGENTFDESSQEQGGFGPKEVHVVLLDNGRVNAARQGYNEVLYCLNCGACLNYCPVYGEIGSAFGSKYIGGRGVVFTAFHQGMSSAQKAGLNLCIGCRSCVEVCPVKIDTPGMIARLRDQARINSFAKRVVLNQIFAKRRLPAVIRLARSMQKVLFTPVPIGMKLRFKQGAYSQRLFPALEQEPLINQYPEIIKPSIQTQKRVVFFTGCMTNFSYTDIGAAVITVLQHCGVEVCLPPQQACCGMPLLYGGELDAARQLARHNLALLTSYEADAIVTCCSSCIGALKEEYPRLLADDPDIQQSIARLKDDILDISEFLIDRMNLSIPAGKALDVKVTYHDPCHLARSVGIRRQPRELLKSIPGVELVEMEEADTCCGCGGSFSLNYYNLSRQINDRKLGHVRRTGAGVLATGCPGCMMHFRDGLSQAKDEVEVLHPIQLLDRSYR